MVKMVEGTEIVEPLTPESQKGMSTAVREIHNLNPKNLGILSQTECDYYANLLVK